MDRKRLLRNPLIWIVVFFLVYLGVSSLLSDTRGFTEAPTSLALQQVEARNASEITIEDKEQRLRLTLTNPVQVPGVDGAAPTTTNQIYAQYPAAATDQVFALVRENPAGSGFDTRVTQDSILTQMLIYLIPLGLVLLLLFWMMNSQGGGNRVLSFGKSKAKQLNKDMPKTTFSDVAGANEAVEELYEIKDFLQNPARYQQLGAKIPKGVLLYGPPGTGKTLLARAVAGEAGVPFYTISGSDFVEMFVGVGASRVRDLFEQAKQNSPCIVFVDEIDAVGRHRGAGMGGGHDEREQTLNQLLVEMDGFDARGGIILIAATNRPDILDPALLRPGRFDRQIPVAAPDLAGRRAILAVHSAGKPLAPEADLDGLAKRTVGFSGADLANVINEAALLTARLGKTQIDSAALEESVDRVIGGPARRSRIISEQEKKVAAYHEAGHALAAWAMPDIEPVYKVTILPRGRTGGHALVVPEDDKELMTRSEMLARLVFAMGGRSAEELVFHEPTTGASSDIEQATKIARAMVTEYGMSAKLGAVKYGQEDGEPFLGRTAGKQNDYSLEVAHEIDEEVRKLIEAAHTEAWDILNVHRDSLDALTGRAHRARDAAAPRPRAHLRVGHQAAPDHRVQRLRRARAVRPPADQDPARAGRRARRAVAPARRAARGARHRRLRRRQRARGGARRQRLLRRPRRGQRARPVPRRRPTSRPPRPRARPPRASRTSTAAGPAPARTVAAAVAPPRTSRRRWRPNYGAPPGWTPATVPHGTTWNPGGAGRSGGPGQGQAQGPGQYGASRPAGEAVPNPYGDPDGRTREGRSDGWPEGRPEGRHTGSSSTGWGHDGSDGTTGSSGTDGRDTPRGQG